MLGHFPGPQVSPHAVELADQQTMEALYMLFHSTQTEACPAHLELGPSHPATVDQR